MNNSRQLQLQCKKKRKVCNDTKVDDVQNSSKGEKGVSISRQTKYYRKKAELNAAVANNLLSFQRGFFSLFKWFLPEETFHDESPTLGCIIPLLESTKFRVNIGSHHEQFTRKKKTYHKELDYLLEIEPGCCVCFLADSTIHSGGPSTTPCTRFFYLFGDKEKVCEVENKNHSNVLQYCETNCDICARVRDYKLKNNDMLIPPMTREAAIEFFTLEDHGFCVLEFLKGGKIETCEKKFKQFRNCVTNIPQNLFKLQFSSLGQEERKSSNGERQIFDFNRTRVRGKGHCGQEFLNRLFQGIVGRFLSLAEDKVISHANSTFTTKSYEKKGRTVLTNKGIVDYQKPHLDMLPKQF